jgi:alcohol dehydrogenase class IV
VAVRNLRSALVRLRNDLKLPGTLQAAGIPSRELWENMERIVKATLEDPCCATNPLTVEDFMVRRILEEVTGRG